MRMLCSGVVFQIAYQTDVARSENMVHSAFNEEGSIPLVVPRSSTEKFEIFKCGVFTCD